MHQCWRQLRARPSPQQGYRSRFGAGGLWGGEHCRPHDPAGLWRHPHPTRPQPWGAHGGNCPGSTPVGAAISSPTGGGGRSSATIKGTNAKILCQTKAQCQLQHLPPVYLEGITLQSSSPWKISGELKSLNSKFLRLGYGSLLALTGAGKAVFSLLSIVLGIAMLFVNSITPGD